MAGKKKPPEEIRENRPARQKRELAETRKRLTQVAPAKASAVLKKSHELQKQSAEESPEKSPEELEREQKRLEIRRQIEKRKSGYMPIEDHLEELRWRIIRIILWVTVFSIVSFFFYKEIWEFVMGPILPLINNAEKNYNMVVKIVTNKLTDFFVIQIKTVVIVGAIASVPFILFELWGFVLPALRKTSRFLGNALLISSVLLFWGGGLFARYTIWPLVTELLIYDWMPPGMLLQTGETSRMIQPELLLTIDDYLNFFFSFHLAFGAAFQLPVVSVLLAMIGILKSAFFTASWRFAVLIIAIASAILTPPDVFSMIAMMIPMLILYIISGFLVFLIEKSRKDEE